MTAPTTTASTDPKETTVTAPNTTVEAPEAPEKELDTADAPEGTETGPEGGEGTDAAALRREAANYRTRLRDAEAERDRLAEKLTTYQRRDVVDMVGDRLLSADDLWVGDATKLEDLLAEDGTTVDKKKVDEAVRKVLAAHPHWGPVRESRRVPRDMGQGRRSEPTGGVRPMQEILRGA